VFLAKVRGTVVATAKRPGLTGRTLVLLERLTAVGEEAETGRSRQGSMVAVDMVGAPEGSTVIVCTGSAARFEAGPDAPVDMAVVGIVDYAVQGGQRLEDV